MEAGNSSVVQPLDPFGRAVGSVTQRDVELGNLSVIDDIPIRGLLELVFVMFNMVMQAFNLLLKVVHFNGGLGFASSDGGEEAISDGSENVWVKLGMGSEGCRNSTG
jgi:hypothetical protein